MELHNKIDYLDATIRKEDISQFVAQIPKVDHRVHNSPPPAPTPSQLNPIHPQPISLRSALIPASRLRLDLRSSLFPTGSPTQTFNTFLSSPMRATCPAHLIVDLICMKNDYSLIFQCGKPTMWTTVNQCEPSSIANSFILAKINETKCLPNMENSIIRGLPGTLYWHTKNITRPYCSKT
jgi:hypothetical protein